MARSIFFTSCLIWASCLVSAHVCAAAIEIGRASVEMPTGVWKQVASSEGEILVDGGVNGRIRTDDRAFAFMDGERVLALLLISSSKGAGGATLKWNNTCAGTNNTYAYDMATHVIALGCARATGGLPTLAYLKLAVPKMFKSLEALEPVLPQISDSASAIVANDNGVSVHVNLVAAPVFAGSSAQPLAVVPTGVNPRHAAWADRLAEAIRDSVYSRGGKLVIPSVEFTTTPTPAQMVSTSKCVTEEAGPPDVAITVHGATGEGFVVCGENSSFLPQQVKLEVVEAENLTFLATFPFETVLPAKTPARLLFTFSPADLHKGSFYKHQWINYPGDPRTKPDEKFLYAFPFEHGTKHRVSQGYLGIFSHSEENTYALDFDMDIGTPVMAARSGLVAEVKADSNTGGLTREYRDKANYVKILHDDGTIGVYVHLKFNGVVVNPGDKVNAGQLIGYSGDTGFLSGPHLHFEVQQPRTGAMPTSIPTVFRSPDGLPLQVEEGRYYYAAYEGGPAFPVRFQAVILRNSEDDHMPPQNRCS